MDLFSRREVTFQEAKLFAEQLGIEMVEVSSLRSSLQNIDVLFQILREKVFEPLSQPHYKSENSPPALPPRDMHSSYEREEIGGGTFISEMERMQSSGEKLGD